MIKPIKMNLPIDIIKIILFYLPIIDKRNLIRSCKYLNQLYPLMKIFESEFVELLNLTKFIANKPIKLNQCELYALEYIYYDRKNIPDKYLDYNKNLLTKHSLLYFNMAINQINVCKKIYQKYKKEVFIHSMTDGAASVGNLEMIKWGMANGCKWNTDKCMFAAQSGNLEVLKWLRENRCARKNIQLCCIFFRSCEKECKHTFSSSMG